ncbi:hypothetical protein TNCV_1314091 [Trichonephila clavipes]|nr:hypothetical protein TNCV_1314091 [Trichonephila clavipes]
MPSCFITIPEERGTTPGEVGLLPVGSRRAPSRKYTLPASQFEKTVHHARNPCAKFQKLIQVVLRILEALGIYTNVGPIYDQ